MFHRQAVTDEGFGRAFYAAIILGLVPTVNRGLIYFLL